MTILVQEIFIIRPEQSPPALHILYNTPDSDNQLIRWELHELNWLCQNRETYEMCRVVNPQDQNWKPLKYADEGKLLY